MFSNSPRRRPPMYVLAAAVVLLTATLGAGPVGAQDAPANNSTTVHHWIGAPDTGQTTPPAPSTTTTPESDASEDTTTQSAGEGENGGDSDDDDGGGGLLGGVGGFVPSINPVDMAKGQLEAIAGIFLGVGEVIADAVRDSVASVPAPGQPDKPHTWINPQNGIWPGVYSASKWTMALASIVLMAGFGMSFYRQDPYEKRQAWKRIGLALFMVATTWIIPPMLLHAANETAMSVAPDGAEFMESNANLAKLGVGIAVGAILGVVQSGTVAVGILILGLERALIYAGVFFWPLAWACRGFSGFLKSIGETFTHLFGVVLVTKIAQVLILRLMADLPWTSSALGALETLILTVGGLVFALLLLPKSMMAHANDAASFSLGMSSANQRQAGKYIDKAGERVGHGIHEKYKDYRSGDDADDGANWEQSDNSTFGVGAGSSSDESSKSTGSSRPNSTALNADGGIDAQQVREEQDRADYELNRGFQ